MKNRTPRRKIFILIWRCCSALPCLRHRLGWNRFKASRDFMEWFKGLAGDQTVATLPQSEAFVQAGAAGKSVVEFYRRGKAAKATLALVGTVREAAGFPKE